MAGSSQLQSHRSTKKREIDLGRGNRSKQCNDSESDTSGSPINEFSNGPTYRVPTKSRAGIFSKG